MPRAVESLKTVLVIDDSELIRGYLETKLVALN